MIIWIASYPRSGNTFLRVILKSVFGLETYSIYDDKSVIAKDAATSDVVGHKMLPENFDLETARESNELYLIKTHDVVRYPHDKVIYLVRDGRQSALSYRNYINNFQGRSCGITDVLYGNVPFGSWGEHVSQWNLSGRENLLVLTFENLTAAPERYLERISRFIGRDYQSTEVPDFEFLHKVNPKFFHQGKSDSWKKEFDRRELEIFWLNNYCQMRDLYPKEEFPEFLVDDKVSSMISSHFADQARYFTAIIRENDLALATKATEIRKLEASVSSLKAELSKSQNALGRLRSIIGRMLAIKFWKSPSKKYRVYKELIEETMRNGD